jgi:hypothetical protein
MNLALHLPRVRSSEVLHGIWSLDIENDYDDNCYKYGDAKMPDRPLARDSEPLVDRNKGKRPIDRGSHCEQAQWQRK